MENRNSGDGNSGHWNSGHWNSGDWNSGHGNSGHGNSWDRNSGDGNSGHGNSGHRNSGDWNSGHWNSGMFNSNEPFLRMFNKETILKKSEFDCSKININLKINEWVPEKKMNDEEKKSNPKFFVTKGYLKTIDYKEAWKIAWKDTTEETKNFIKNLPNFDSVIFYDIAGIDLSVDTDKIKKDMIEQAEKLLSAGKELLNKAKSIL